MVVQNLVLPYVKLHVLVYKHYNKTFKILAIAKQAVNMGCLTTQYASGLNVIKSTNDRTRTCKPLRAIVSKTTVFPFHHAGISRPTKI